MTAPCSYYLTADLDYVGSVARPFVIFGSAAVCCRCSSNATMRSRSPAELHDGMAVPYWPSRICVKNSIWKSPNSPVHVVARRESTAAWGPRR